MPVETASRETALRETALQGTSPEVAPWERAEAPPSHCTAVPVQDHLIPKSPALTPPVQFDLGFSRESGLEHIRELVEDDDKGKWDATALRQALCWHGDRLVLPDDLSAENREGQIPPLLSPTPWATAQLCAQLGVPAAYFRRCPPHLKEAQFNHWLGAVALEDRTPDLWLLRGKGTALRGVLSARYARIDNRDLLACLLPLIDDRFQVSWHAVTGESFHLRLVDPALSRDALPGDRLMAGLHVGNSEVGKRSVSIDAIVFRQICSNGLIRIIDGRGLLRQRHVSWDPPRFKERLSKAISLALVEGAAFLERLALTARVPVPDPEGALAFLGERWSLPLRTRQTIRLNLLATPAAHQENLYSLVNAVTQAAQGLAPDDRYDLEALAGGLAERGLPRNLVPRNMSPRDVAAQEEKGDGE